jgi:hypothetical protein
VHDLRFVPITGVFDPRNVIGKNAFESFGIAVNRGLAPIVLNPDKLGLVWGLRRVAYDASRAALAGFMTLSFSGAEFGFRR